MLRFIFTHEKKSLIMENILMNKVNIFEINSRFNITN